MNKFDVIVTGVKYQEAFLIEAKTKANAMIRGITLARMMDKPAGELTATAKVVR